MRATEWAITSDFFLRTLTTLHIRVWAKAEDLSDAGELYHKQHCIETCINTVVLTNPVRIDIDTAEALAALPFCNAVEVRHGDAPAVLIYPEWP